MSDDVTVSADPATQAMMSYDIQLIAESPFAKSVAGKAIVRILWEYNDNKQILYDETVDEARADWDGKTIRINNTFTGKVLPTTVELVHEGSHILWRKGHRKPTDPNQALADHLADEELARKNQVEVYLWLRDKKKLPGDPELEARLAKK